MGKIKDSKTQIFRPRHGVFCYDQPQSPSCKDNLSQFSAAFLSLRTEYLDLHSVAVATCKMQGAQSDFPCNLVIVAQLFPVKENAQRRSVDFSEKLAPTLLQQQRQVRKKGVKKMTRISSNHSKDSKNEFYTPTLIEKTV